MEGNSKSTDRMKPVLKCRVIRAENVEKADNSPRAASKGLEEDPFTGLYRKGQILEPPFDLLTLALMPEQSTELGPSLDAMSVNIEKMGHRIVARTGAQDKNGNMSDDVKAQRARVKNFFSNAILDQEIGTLDEFRDRLRKDRETTGNAYIEVIPKIGQMDVPAGFNHLPSWTMRLRKMDDYFTDYEVPRAVQDDDESWRMVKFPTAKRFRRFVQIQENGMKEVYFKEWGDPRPILASTGEVAPEGTPQEELAHEVIHLKLYSSRSPYGLPRWIGHLFAIYGTRAAEEINYMTFENNQIPAMALLATNVAVTDGSIARMKEFIEERVQGNKNYATILMVEAEPVGEGMKDPSAMKLEMKPLTEFQHSDAMFEKYIQMNNDMIRRAFRLPPIFVGRAEDYNRAVAEASRKLAEEQIFYPERTAMDTMFTQTIIARLGEPSVEFKSNTPNVTDNYELTQLLAVAERSGGLTPRTSTRITEDVLGQELPEPDPSINPDIPFTLTMERERSKLQQEGMQPGEQGNGNGRVHGDDELTNMVTRLLQRNNEEGILDHDQAAFFERMLLNNS